MKFNVMKCKIIHIGRNNGQADYTMNGVKLQKVSEEKDLGIIVSDDLKPSKHCQMAYNKATKMSALIRRTVVNKTPFVMTKLYKTLVRPHVEYGMSVWSPWYVKDRILVEKVQRRFTRSIQGLQGMDYNGRITNLGLWTLEERRNRNDLIEVYRMTHGHSSVQMSAFFEIPSDKTTRGHNYTIYKKMTQREVRSHFFSNRVVNRWNRLDREVVNAASVQAFKSGLDRIRRKKIGFFMDI